MTYLAIDYGEARIGLAYSNKPYIIASPYKTVDNSDKELAKKEILAIIIELKASKVFIGKPLSLDGSASIAVDNIAAWASFLQEFSHNQNLSNALVAPSIEFIDERMTTALAQKKLRAAGKNAKTSRSIIDQAAAMEILQSAIDRY